MASEDRVGVIVLGIMGSAMSGNLIGAGVTVFDYDVLARRRGEFSKAGGRTTQSVRDLAKRASIVITSLPTSAALLEVALRPFARCWKDGQRYGGVLSQSG